MALRELQHIINHSESKANLRTPFEFLHGYRPKLGWILGCIRAPWALTLISNEWAALEELRQSARYQHNQHRHYHTYYSLGEIVLIKTAPENTGESAKLQDRYRGILVVSEVLPSDVYRVVELNNSKRPISRPIRVRRAPGWTQEFIL